MRISNLESKNLVGKTWGDLTEEQQQNILSVSNVNDNAKEGACIVDIDEELAIAGTVVCEFEDEVGELIISDEAMFYNPIA